SASSRLHRHDSMPVRFGGKRQGIPKPCEEGRLRRARKSRSNDRNIPPEESRSFAARRLIGETEHLRDVAGAEAPADVLVEVDERDDEAPAASARPASAREARARERHRERVGVRARRAEEASRTPPR